MIAVNEEECLQRGGAEARRKIRKLKNWCRYWRLVLGGDGLNRDYSFLLSSPHLRASAFNPNLVVVSEPLGRIKTSRCPPRAAHPPRVLFSRGMGRSPIGTPNTNTGTDRWRWRRPWNRRWRRNGT